MKGLYLPLMELASFHVAIATILKYFQIHWGNFINLKLIKLMSHKLSKRPNLFKKYKYFSVTDCSLSEQTYALELKSIAFNTKSKRKEIKWDKQKYWFVKGKLNVQKFHFKQRWFSLQSTTNRTKNHRKA